MRLVRLCRHALALIAIAVLLSACSSNPQTTFPPVTGQSGGGIPTNNAASNGWSTANSNVFLSSGKIQPRAAPHDQMLYVADSYFGPLDNLIGGSITAYPLNSAGDAMPVVDLTGAATQLDRPFGVAIGADKTVYVANYNGNDGNKYILVFPPDATGNSLPSAIIVGSATTMLACPHAIAVDNSGYIYVTCPNDAVLNGFLTSRILVFAPNSTGDVAPVRVIGAVDAQPWGISIGPDGNIYVVGSTPEIEVYAGGGNGNAAALATYKGPPLNDPIGIAVDQSRKIYVTNNGDNSVQIFSQTSRGTLKSIGAISGNNTGLNDIIGIAVDSQFVYVGVRGSNSIEIFRKTARGNVFPERVIDGAATLLHSPFFITLGPR